MATAALSRRQLSRWAERDGHGLVLVDGVPGPQAELQATVGQEVDRGRLAGQQHRVVEPVVEHQRADSQRGGDVGRVDERGEGVGGAEVVGRLAGREAEALGLAGQVVPGGPVLVGQGLQGEAEGSQRGHCFTLRSCICHDPHCRPAANSSDAPVSLAAGVVAAGGIACCIRQGSQSLDDKQVPMAGMVAAFIFAVQMLELPGGRAARSGHLLGGVPGLRSWSGRTSGRWRCRWCCWCRACCSPTAG